jgi:hypothetical protein
MLASNLSFLGTISPQSGETLQGEQTGQTDALIASIQ